MKVVQILPELNAGGVERGTLEVGKYLVDQGHESIVISNGGRLVKRPEPADLSTLNKARSSITVGGIAVGDVACTGHHGLG